MTGCLLSLGANLGDARSTIAQAVDHLRRTLGVETSRWRQSRPYRTPPVGGPAGQPPFINAAAAFETERTAWDVWQTIRECEAAFGRQRNRRWEARPIDIDILLFGQQRIWTPQLKIPHPRMCLRRFILEPAAEVAGDMLDPVTQRSIAQLCDALRGSPTCLWIASAAAQDSQPLIAEASRRAVAGWLTTAQLRTRGPELETHTRYVVHTTLDELQVSQTVCGWNPQLIVVLAAAPTQRSRQEGVAWEDYHRELAVALRLADPPPGVAPLHIAGPRYLLSTEDPQWAIHELVSAFDAMDCPVEVLQT